MRFTSYIYRAISIKVVHEQSGKVEYERERLLGIAKKLMNFHSDSQQPFALVFDFPALLVDNLKAIFPIAVALPARVERALKICSRGRDGLQKQ